MACEKLTAKNLHLVHNGAAGILIDREIQRAVTDLQDRGKEDKKPRMVNIQIELAKVGDGIDVTFLKNQEDGDGEIEQRELYKALRTTFKRCVDPKVVEAIKNLKFEALTAGTSEHQRGKSSMGQLVTKELKGVIELPEDVTFQKVAVFAGHVEYVDKCECYLDPDEKSNTLTLQPIAGEIARIAANAENAIGQRLGEAFESIEGDSKFSKVLLYCGKP